MFGANRDKNQPDGTIAGPQMATPPPDDTTGPQMPPPPMSDVGNGDSGELTVPDAPVIMPTVPQMGDSQASAPSAPPMPGPMPPGDTGPTGNVKLENAYIESPAPQVIRKTDKSSAQPTATAMVAPANEGELINLKQQALQNLTPLVDQLEQSPEEKFKTTMMLIQASDNADLVKDAYEAANQIKDEKARAQALLDVVNEINYFTQHHEENPS